MALQSVNPRTGVLIREYPETSGDDVAKALSAAHQAFLSWREISFADRSLPLRRAAALLREGKEELAKLMALEMGKPLAQGRAEAEKCAWVCEYYAAEAEGFLKPQTIATDASRSFVAPDFRSRFSA